MKNTITLYLTASLLLGWVAAASADVLELKDGKVLTGKYVGGTAGTIRLETGGGIQVIETSQALALTFSGGGAGGRTCRRTCSLRNRGGPRSRTGGSRSQRRFDFRRHYVAGADGGRRIL